MNIFQQIQQISLAAQHHKYHRMKKEVFLGDQLKFDTASIGHFRVAVNLTMKARLSAKLFI